jgi:hypothetical protein
MCRGNSGFLFTKNLTQIDLHNCAAGSAEAEAAAAAEIVRARATAAAPTGRPSEKLILNAV